MGAFHSFLGQAAIYFNATIGLWAIGLSIAKRPLGKSFFALAGLGITAIVTQVTIGLVMFSRGFDPGSKHMFYGIVILFAVSFAYVYRAQFARRPQLSWGILLLFLAGLGIRGWMSFLEWF